MKGINLTPTQAAQRYNTLPLIVWELKDQNWSETKEEIPDDAWESETERGEE